LSRRLPVTRVAVTEPPRDWFGGISHAFYERYRRALIELGLEVFDVPVDAFVSYADEARCADIIGDLRSFRPELALGLPLGVHALVCRLPPGRDGFQPNLFTDVLDIPTICTWDHAPFELAEQLLTPHPAAPPQSTSGTLKRLRMALDHPRLIPWSRDSGQAARMQQFGLLPRAPLFEISPSFPDMTAPAPAATAGTPSIAYIGALYPEKPAERPPALARLATGATARWLTRGGACWDEIAHGIAALPADQRAALALDPDQSFFWAFVHRVIVHEAQTAKRLEILGATDRPIAFYGKPHAELPHHLQPMGTVPFGPALAAAYARHPIVIDAQSAGFIHGFGHKPIHAFAAGGFMLVDRKADFIAAFGDAGEAVSYGSNEELAVKVERFLAAPAYRREVGDAIRARIAERHSLPDVLARILEQAAATATVARPVPASTATDLLTRLGRYGLLSRSRLRRDSGGATITTPPGRWTYAAAVHLPPTRAARLEATMIVEAGRVDIGLLSDDHSRLTGEQALGPSRHPATVRLELPDDRPHTVVLRNAGDGASRVRISTLVLREPS
jgi:hypothetical protein